MNASTKNPVLNLSKLLLSRICKLLASNSNKDNEVVSSKFVRRVSSLPMSLIVYLLLSFSEIKALCGA